MTSRLLPPNEWHRLKEAGAELGEVCQYLDGAQTFLMVIEDAGAIVGCWAMFPVMHLEGVWVAPMHRGKGSVARRLLTFMRSIARLNGAALAVTTCMDAQIRQVITKLHGQPVPGEQFFVPIGE